MQVITIRTSFTYPESSCGYYIYTTCMLAMIRLLIYIDWFDVTKECHLSSKLSLHGL